MDLRAAFLGTTYGTAEERFRLAAEPGPAPSWTRGNWAVVTAWNPGGRRAAAAQNLQAAAALLDRVRAAGFSPLPAHNGEGDDGESEWWEDALIVPGARLEQAAAWGAEFGQAAVLWGTGRRVALVWLDGVRPGGEGRVRGVERFWARWLGAA